MSRLFYVFQTQKQFEIFLLYKNQKFSIAVNHKKNIIFAFEVIKKLSAILILFVFGLIILSPVMPFVQTYVHHHYEEENSLCQQYPHNDKEFKTGDPYLNALLKRVCENHKKQQPKAPVSFNQIVFIKTLYTPVSNPVVTEETSLTRISDFIPEKVYPDIILSIEHPPAV